jgi:hypothetical protein
MRALAVHQGVRTCFALSLAYFVLAVDCAHGDSVSISPGVTHGTGAPSMVIESTTPCGAAAPRCLKRTTQHSRAIRVVESNHERLPRSCAKYYSNAREVLIDRAFWPDRESGWRSAPSRRGVLSQTSAHWNRYCGYAFTLSATESATCSLVITSQRPWPSGGIASCYPWKQSPPLPT